MGIPDHLTYLLRNLYAGQEETVRTGHGTTGWFQIGKGVCQGCILSCCLCKTQNSGLRSKEEKPRDPISQPSRCNTQEGLLSVVQTGDSDLLGCRAPRTANWASFLYAKKPYYQHITYGLQSDWLHVCKAILLAQTSRALVQT